MAYLLDLGDDSNLKTKKKKARTRSKSKTHKRTKTHARTRTRAVQPARVDLAPKPDTIVNPNVKACQELEVGDIGGFGSPEELEEHEKRCGEPATEFCSGCGKNLCHAHYDLLHRDHDSLTGQTGNRDLAQQ